ncbi:hypothetical protein DAPPUDRAFT_328104 [Daphnia pulex]|uniref:Leucine zipper transcription factor-like protein 1 n=1 Tax=Daphnia pulex TaxID=6669 RepID=E9HCI5_DAPPU|nr:hypothetical protein DAPPUDRAFT_328104 [Daphnia pulex]|eukprot:EFX70526.1 hypothetical protein DAPPUDRAFT_328104 [Daphnia pulex]
MEYLLVCFFVYVWTMILFHESEKDESNYPTPDIKSVTELPDAKLANQDQTTKMKPGTRYRSVLNTPTVRLNRFNCKTLPSIPENQDGEDCAAEVEKLSAELKTTRYELQQQQQLALSLQLLPDQIKTELISVRKSLSEVTTSNDKLQRHLSCLTAEKDELLEQLEQNKITTVEAIEKVTKSYEHQMTQLRNEFTATNQTVKPLTMDVECGCVVEVANTSTQTGQSETKEGACGTEEPVPSQLLSQQVIGHSERHATKDEDYGFELDFELMERNKHRRRSFYIPARERTKSPVQEIAPKPQVYFPVSDIRYKNKPISGYVVNPDGSTVTYGDALKSTKKPSTVDLQPTQKTEDNAVRNPAPDNSKNNPHTIISAGPVKTEEDLVVVSSPIEEKSLPGNRLLLTNIQGGDYGRIVGSGGSNIHRIETEYEIAVSIRGSADGTYTLMISGNNEEMRKAAADNIIRGLTVVTECSNFQLLKMIKNFRLYEIGRKHYVRINRTFASDGTSGKMTLIGRLSSCQSAYAELLAEVNVSSSIKQKKRA